MVAAPAIRDRITELRRVPARDLMACERLGRRCYAMEIDPHYVDVAVRRWEQFVGRTAVLDGG